VNIFDEAWRVKDDFFYDTGMHGVAWNAKKVKYQPFLKDVSGRTD
jgi:tricorn protease